MGAAALARMAGASPTFLAAWDAHLASKCNIGGCYCPPVVRTPLITRYIFQCGPCAQSEESLSTLADEARGLLAGVNTEGFPNALMAWKL